MPSDGLLKIMNSAHRVLLKASFGKLGWKMGPMPVIELTTTGRKSGQRRSVMLTSPVQQGDDIVIVASKGGEDTHPAWFLNLRDDPAVEVAQGGKPPKPYTASVLPDDERDALWPQVEKTYKGYAGYQTKTDRKIPLVRLSPAS
ncbi:MAG TPA: nitroreductase/quinone reductase family protein [Acidimicrobiales bacterium]|nr:nitroreductase/quinone reductase family protein [Acidimicrobiales bacterium]